jgi:quinol monooxygenase YgiN
VISVEFTVRPGHVAAFRDRVTKQAAASLDEAGCRRFDVLVAPDDPLRFFLYEIYVDREAFAVHLASQHFKEFDEVTRAWVETKQVKAWQPL